MSSTPCLLGACAFLAALPAWAQSAPVPSTFLGAGIWNRPAYVGSDTQVSVPIPVIRYYGKPWFARTTQGILEGGARVELWEGLALGIQVAYEGGRARGESEFLQEHNLETLSPGASWGVHAECDRNLGPVPVNVLMRYRQDTDSSRGAQTDLRLTVGIFGGERLNAGLFAQATWATRNSHQRYYGLTQPQAAASHLPAYAPTGGLGQSVLGLVGSFALGPRWLLQGSLEDRRVQGEVRPSPLVRVRGNRFVSLGLAYQL